VVKERCLRDHMTLKQYINGLVRQDMMRADERISIRYFKE